jgi:hypothetical protein
MVETLKLVVAVVQEVPDIRITAAAMNQGEELVNNIQHLLVL